MGRTWAISGVDLHLDLKGSRVRAALEAALRDAIASGRLQPGTRLPSSRALAADLEVARNTVAEAASYEALDYTDPRGLEQLRSALAAYVARARGVQITPARVLVCSGFTQGFGLLCDVIRARGANTIALEQYVQPGIVEIAAARGLQVAALPVDEQGAVVDQLGPADAVLLTPAHQFPLGVSLAAARRTAVIEWARRTGALVIEDDYDGEFRHDRHPLGALQALAPERVVYAGRASKTLAPGVRLAWLAVPEQMVDELVQAKALADRSGSAFDQLTLAELVTSGAYDRHVRRSRLDYRRRRDRLVAAL